MKKQAHWSRWLAAGVAVVTAAVSASYTAALAALGAFCSLFSGSGRFGEFFGGLFGGLDAISYSLYLFNVPVGGRVVNLGSRFVEGPLAMGLVDVIGTAVSIISSWFFWRWIEKPIHQWSRKWRNSKN